MSDLAQQAVTLRLPVFACDAEKRPLRKGGFKTATMDAALIEQDFADQRAVMIGMPTGSASGLVAIDIDVRGGKPGLRWLEENQDALPEANRIHRTRSGGMHLIMQMPRDRDIRNSAGRLAEGVDVRGTGGYIIVPPSPNYTVSHGAPPAEMPRWLVSACSPPQRKAYTGPKADFSASPEQARKAMFRALDKVATALEGGRNDLLNQQAFILGMYVGAGMLSADQVASELFGAGRAAGLTATEIEATLRSGLDAGRRHPVQSA